MYHRFNENKYPSTNIQMEVFKKHVEIIENNNLDYIIPSNFLDNFNIWSSNLAKETSPIGLFKIGVEIALIA